MERCKFSPLRLSLYIDGQCSSEEKTEIEQHVSVCDRCQKEIILLYTASLALRAFSNVKLPDNLDKNFLERLYQEKTSKK